MVTSLSEWVTDGLSEWAKSKQIHRGASLLKRRLAYCYASAGKASRGKSVFCIREATKKVLFLVAQPLRPYPPSSSLVDFLVFKFWEKKSPQHFWTKRAIFLAKYCNKIVKKNNDFANSVHLSIDMSSYQENLKIKYVLFTIGNKIKKKVS